MRCVLLAGIRFDRFGVREPSSRFLSTQANSNRPPAALLPPTQSEQPADCQRVGGVVAGDGASGGAVAGGGIVVAGRVAG